MKNKSMKYELIFGVARLNSTDPFLSPTLLIDWVCHECEMITTIVTITLEKGQTFTLPSQLQSQHDLAEMKYNTIVIQYLSFITF